jgi:hypothetical protein
MGAVRGSLSRETARSNVHSIIREWLARHAAILKGRSADENRHGPGVAVEFVLRDDPIQQRIAQVFSLDWCIGELFGHTEKRLEPALDQLLENAMWVTKHSSPQERLGSGDHTTWTDPYAGFTWTINVGAGREAS